MEEEYGRSYVIPIIKTEEEAPRELQIIQSKFYQKTGGTNYQTTNL